jgi:hypothetical protein
MAGLKLAIWDINLAELRTSMNQHAMMTIFITLGTFSLCSLYYTLNNSQIAKSINS